MSDKIQDRESQETRPQAEGRRDRGGRTGRTRATKAVLYRRPTAAATSIKTSGRSPTATARMSVTVSDGTTFSAKWDQSEMSGFRPAGIDRVNHHTGGDRRGQAAPLGKSEDEVETNELVEQRPDGSAAIRFGQRCPEYVDLGAPPPNPRSLSPDSTRLFLKKTEPLSRLGLQP